MRHCELVIYMRCRGELCSPGGKVYLMAEIRLDKLLSNAADMSRSAAREAIKKGRVRVGGSVALEPEIKVGEDALLELDGKLISAEQFLYIMLHKPQGVISATSDSEQKTVLDLLPQSFSNRNLFPIGRLDKDTTGLIILTNDGDYGHRVTHPKHCIPKLYELYTAEGMYPEDAEAFALGITLSDGTNCLPARLLIDDTDARHGFLEVFEGKYHQVKRMIASRGNAVERLHRVSIGRLVLNEGLEAGEFCLLTAEEARDVFNA